MNTDLFFGERRLHERKSCVSAVAIHDYTRTHTSHLRDLSLGGALVERPLNLHPVVDQEVVLTLEFRTKPGQVAVRGRVVRSFFDQFAVAFHKRQKVKR